MNTFLAAAPTSWLLHTLACTLRLPPVSLPDTPCVMLIWHEEILPAMRFFAHRNAMAMVSPSRDGQQMAWLLSRQSIAAVYASTYQHTFTGTRKMLRLASQYKICIFAADGPRGPRQQIHPGGIWLASRLGYPLYACRFHYPGWRLNSWDHAHIPYPFAKVTITLSSPQRIAPRPNLEILCKQWEDTMHQLGKL